MLRENLYIYRKFAANWSMWGSLTLAPINIYVTLSAKIDHLGWVGAKPGLWTLDWTVDWTLDWILDWILDSIIHGPEGIITYIQKTKLVHNKYNTHT